MANCDLLDSFGCGPLRVAERRGSEGLKVWKTENVPPQHAGSQDARFLRLRLHVAVAGDLEGAVVAGQGEQGFVGLPFNAVAKQFGRNAGKPSTALVGPFEGGV